ncbi:MAG: hypothetical protein LBJ11_10250 [Oscillospiraceae bacterium]|jgi:hypothetical protein|nr:hypothetical protein [Oscillospiraceae bacterium]
MKIVYLISKLFSYPGAFLKGFWEHLTCRVLKVPVYDRVYLLANYHCGHTWHGPVRKTSTLFLLAFLPWLAQKLTALIFLCASAIPLILFGLRSATETSAFFFNLLCLFLGLSCLSNAYPEWEDAKELWRRVYHGEDGTFTAESAARDARPGPIPYTDGEKLTTGEDEAAYETYLGDGALLSPSAEPVDEEIAGAAPDGEELLPVAPVSLAAKILLAPFHLAFVIGAGMERTGLPVLLWYGAAVLAMVLR